MLTVNERFQRCVKYPDLLVPGDNRLQMASESNPEFTYLWQWSWRVAQDLSSTVGTKHP